MKKPGVPFLAAFCFFSVFSLSARAQDHFHFSGLLVSDYSYTVQSPGETDNGDNGFGYRRVYLTADYTISDNFSGRVRFEGADKATNTEGKPAPFIKDMYLKWSNALGAGHHISLGAQNPGKWILAEKTWGYRSLERTVMDRAKIASSRDMGILFSGLLTENGRTKYVFMVANNSGGKQETDKYKRIYGQLDFKANEAFNVSVGGDYCYGLLPSTLRQGYAVDHTDGSRRGNLLLGTAFLNSWCLAFTQKSQFPTEKYHCDYCCSFPGSDGELLHLSGNCR